MVMNAPLTVAVSFDVFSPYTLARLNALGRRANLIGIESAYRSVAYDWDKTIGAENFQRVTLFQEGAVEQRSQKEIRSCVAEMLAELRPDVMAINGWSQPTALALLAWSMKRRIPVVVMSESTSHDAVRMWWREAAKRRIVGLCSAALVGGTRHVSYMQELGMPQAGIFTGYDVVDNAYFADGAERARQDAAQLRAKLGLPKNYFLASARFIAKKNLPGLLKAYALYRASAGEGAWKLVLLGDGPLKPELQAIAAQLGIGQDLILPGFKQYGALPAYYGLARAFVHSSTVEQWGLVVNEAMSAGLPVLVSNRCGCAPDLIVEGENGYVFDPYDVEQLSDLLRLVASEAPRLDTMGRASQRIIADWTPDVFAINMIEACRAALAAGTTVISRADSALLWILKHI
jgi:glycosyltransferase involved in cell wall biosynthesis